MTAALHAADDTTAAETDCSVSGNALTHHGKGKGSDWSLTLRALTPILTHSCLYSSIKVVPVGASRGMKKLLQEKFPNMSRLQDISELLAT